MKVFILSIIALWIQPTLATKPCPPLKCNSPTTCEKVAHWVATGTINKVTHNKQPKPLNKNFAKFWFNIESWQKGKQKNTKGQWFKVGWCDNRQQLPENTSGKFRFYGTQKPGQYVFFEKVK